MTLGVIDVVDWQTTVDLANGLPASVEHPLVSLASELVRRHPYPGDLAPGASRWVTDVALDLNERYGPELMLLVYANAYLAASFKPLSAAARAARIWEVFDEIQRFVNASGFSPIIVGLGGLVPLAGYVYTADLDGRAIAGGMTARYAGLNRPSPRDLAWLASHPGVERVIARDDFCAQFGGVEQFYQRFPDYVLAAREGYLFRGVGSSARPTYAVPGFAQTIPLHTTLGEASALTDLAGLALRALERDKVALILVEGVGCESFPLPFCPISNACHWYCYSIGEGQYLAITAGKHFVERPYPPGYDYLPDDDENKPYPFSGILSELPPDTLGRRWRGKSAAAGSRSILTHTAAGADITVECFARALYNHGAMAVVEV